MPDQLRERGSALVEAGRYAEALPFFLTLLERPDPSWNDLYVAGQCYRFTGDLVKATQLLSQADAMNPGNASVNHALGIALQLGGQYHEAVNAFRRALEVEPDFDLAFNSLALTQEHLGEVEKALHNYDAGALAHTRRITASMTNSRASAIYKHRDTRHQLWLGYAIKGAVLLCTESHALAWPSGDSAAEEERTEEHAGLYWIDLVTEDGSRRLFLPNYFNTFRESLKADAAYSSLIGNRGALLERIGRHDEARQHTEEALEFRPGPWSTPLS